MFFTWERREVFLTISVIGMVIFLLNIAFTKLLMNSAKKIGILDHPNDRSSHSQPTPRGGGLVFSTILIVCSFGAYISDSGFKLISTVLLVGGPIVVAIGWLDDRYKLSATLRLVVHFYSAICVIGISTGWFHESVRFLFLPDIFLLNIIFCILFISWFVNLYNFMDGADGLASSTAVVGSLAMAFLCYESGADRIGIAYIFIACSVAGFLVYNWYPAKLFMGDSGSYFLGFCFASLAIIGKVESGISMYPSIIIFGFFIVDATYTLIMRFLRKQNLYQAHNQFGFHKLMKKGWSHRQVSILYSAVVLFWLFPWAYLSLKYPQFSFFIIALSYLPLLIFEVYNKAGQPS